LRSPLEIKRLWRKGLDSARFYAAWTSHSESGERIVVSVVVNAFDHLADPRVFQGIEAMAVVTTMPIFLLMKPSP